MFVSIVSVWEIIIKTRIGKLGLDLATVLRTMEVQRITLLNVTPAHLLTVETLPLHHRDPFDHLLIAQAIVEGLTFVSNDRHMPQYPVRLMTCA